MGSQKQSGKAFEYAVLQALQQCVGHPNSKIVESQALKVAAADFAGIPNERQQENLQAAAAAAPLLLKFEPHLELARQGKAIVHFALQSDQAGASGDVRDILLSIPARNWEIGISAKHQHEALKHSRLSKQIDFGDKWIGVPCSTQYFETIAPIFDQLKQLQTQGVAWSTLPNKTSEIYFPVLLAFQTELLAIEKTNPGAVARGLVSYLIGNKDFYKVIKLKKQTKVQVFNFTGMLNTAALHTQPEMRLDKLKLPSRIVELDFRRDQSETSSTTLDMICDAGWQLSFRLHNASTRVEPSLKFDINLVGRPNSLQTLTAMW